MFFASVLMLALTRAELIERMRTPPVTVVQGMVSVYADCGAERRNKYQKPVATFAGDICRELYAGCRIGERRFAECAIEIHLGDDTSGATNVIAAIRERADGTRRMKILMPSPEHADMKALETAIVRGFALAVRNEELDDEGARKFLRTIDPVARAEDELAALDAWRDEGRFDGEMDDEAYLKNMRTVHVPGRILAPELRTFASRLYLYSGYERESLAGHGNMLSFREAAALRDSDPRIRLAAYRKITELMVFGGGHGDAMDAVVAAYCAFLNELAAGQDDSELLGKMLDAAEKQLKELETK